MHKLTLSVEPGVVDGAKRYAKARGTSVSRLVETMLRLVAATPADRSARPDATPPVLRRLRGSLRHGSLDDHRRHLARKYR